MINQRGFFNLRTTQWFTLAIDGSAPADFNFLKIFGWSLALAPYSLMILPAGRFSDRTTYQYIKELMQKYKIFLFNKRANSSTSLKAQVQGLSLPKFVKINGHPFKRLFDKWNDRVIWCDETRVFGGTDFLSHEMNEQMKAFYPSITIIRKDKFR